MSHDDTQTGIFPLCPERFLNTTEGTFEICPILKNIALKAVHRSAVQAGSAGETCLRGIRGNQVFDDFRFHARFHGHPV